MKEPLFTMQQGWQVRTQRKDQIQCQLLMPLVEIQIKNAIIFNAHQESTSNKFNHMQLRSSSIDKIKAQKCQMQSPVRTISTHEYTLKDDILVKNESPSKRMDVGPGSYQTETSSMTGHQTSFNIKSSETFQYLISEDLKRQKQNQQSSQISTYQRISSPQIRRNLSFGKLQQNSLMGQSNIQKAGNNQTSINQSEVTTGIISYKTSRDTTPLRYRQQQQNQYQTQSNLNISGPNYSKSNQLSIISSGNKEPSAYKTYHNSNKQLIYETTPQSNNRQFQQSGTGSFIEMMNSQNSNNTQSITVFNQSSATQIGSLLSSPQKNNTLSPQQQHQQSLLQSHPSINHQFSQSSFGGQQQMQSTQSTQNFQNLQSNTNLQNSQTKKLSNNHTQSSKNMQRVNTIQHIESSTVKKPQKEMQFVVNSKLSHFQDHKFSQTSVKKRQLNNAKSSRNQCDSNSSKSPYMKQTYEQLLRIKLQNSRNKQQRATDSQSMNTKDFELSNTMTTNQPFVMQLFKDEGDIHDLEADERIIQMSPSAQQCTVVIQGDQDYGIIDGNFLDAAQYGVFSISEKESEYSKDQQQIFSNDYQNNNKKFHQVYEDTSFKNDQPSMISLNSQSQVKNVEVQKIKEGKSCYCSASKVN
eukprot:403357011